MNRLDVTDELVEQIDWHWRSQLRPRLEGLSDEEYFWEPVAGAWNVRPRTCSSAETLWGTGEWTIDFVYPPPEPAPGHDRVAAVARAGGRPRRAHRGPLRR